MAKGNKGFNADAFMQQTVEAVMDTQRTPHPVGDFDTFIIEDIEFNSGTIEKGERAGETWVQMKLKCVNTDPNIADEMNLEGDAKPTVYIQEFLDMKDGALDVGAGRNIKLGKIRQAVGQNTDEEWAIGHLKGANIGLSIDQKIGKESGDPYAVVTGYYNPNEDDE